MGTESEISFLEQICLPFLRNAQNADGGWGFTPGGVSRAEPTCWALLAVPAGGSDAARGCAWLASMQCPVGSGPATPEDQTGCWVTSLACLTLSLGDPGADQAVRAALQWICSAWPQDSTTWRRLLRRLSSVRDD